MSTAFVLLLASALAIYLSCEFFVNGIEWCGQRFGVSQMATGSVLAAFGTALPESVVTFVAVVFGTTAEQKELGVGAALGGPLVLSTIAYGVVGLSFFVLKSPTSRDFFSIQSRTGLAKDQRWFMVIFVAKVMLGLVAFSFKPWFGVLFLLAYALYVHQEMRPSVAAAESLEELAPLKIRPAAVRPSLGWILLQTTGAVVTIFFSSQLFVHQLSVIGPFFGMSPQLVALLFSPLATELPEILNAVIWVRQGKQQLALANIGGAMMIQATIPSALGLFFTPWLLAPELIWAAIVTMLSIAGFSLLLRSNKLTGSRLAWFSVIYLVFIAGLIPILYN